MQSFIKSYINHSLSRLVRLKLTSTAVHSRDIFNDIQRLHLKIDTVLDVGANQGQWSLALLKHLPVSKIHCFEPIQSQFSILESSVTTYPQIKPWKLAIGDSVGETKIWLGNTDTNSSLIQTHETQASEVVKSIRLDTFCEQQNIDHVSILKVDTEGFELNVLEGAKGLLQEQYIDLIFAEVGFHSRYKTLVLFDELRSFMEELEYEFFGLYDQQLAWDGKPYVVYGNACFISSKLLNSLD